MDYEQHWGFYYNDEHLAHHGIQGQKWGVRRYQNPDGSLTPEGRIKYRKVFVSGSSKTQNKESPYYRKKLPPEVRDKLDYFMGRKNTILVGDAPGVDTQVQKYLKKKHYKNVEVYGAGDSPRYLANKHWKTHNFNNSKYPVGSKEWLAEKDKAMAKDATHGLAVVIDNGGSKATRKNVQRLVKEGKPVSVYELSSSGKKNGKWTTNAVSEDEIRRTLTGYRKRHTLANAMINYDALKHITDKEMWKENTSKYFLGEPESLGVTYRKRNVRRKIADPAYVKVKY